MAVRVVMAVMTVPPVVVPVRMIPAVVAPVRVPVMATVVAMAVMPMSMSPSRLLHQSFARFGSLARLNSRNWRGLRSKDASSQG